MTRSAHSCRREDLDRAIALLSQIGDQAHVPLFRAVRAGLIGLAFLGDRRQPWSGAEAPAGLATVILLGDDDGQSTGPAGWRAARGALAWARFTIIHGAGGEPEHYAAAVVGALSHRRLLLVETSSAHARTWAEALNGKPGVVLLPRQGQHPVSPDRGAVH